MSFSFLGLAAASPNGCGAPAGAGALAARNR